MSDRAAFWVLLSLQAALLVFVGVLAATAVMTPGIPLAGVPIDGDGVAALGSGGVRAIVTVAHEGADGFELLLQGGSVVHLSFFPAGNRWGVTSFAVDVSGRARDLRWYARWGRLPFHVRPAGGKVALLDVRLEAS